MTTAIAVDIIPGLLIRERDLVGRKTEELSIPFVELPLSRNQLPRQKAIDEWETRSRPELRTGEFGERMEVEVVDRLPCWVLRCVS